MSWSTAMLLAFLFIADDVISVNSETLQLSLHRAAHSHRERRSHQVLRRKLNQKIRRSGAEPLLKEEIHRLYQKLAKSVPESLNDAGYYDETLQMSVGLGTPTQHFNLTLDDEWDHTFFFMAGTPTTNCWNTKTLPSRHWFDPSASSTFVQAYDGFAFALSPPYINYVCGYKLGDNGAISNDTMTIGSLSVTQTPFAWATNASGILNPQWPSDGIFGIGPWGDIFSPPTESTIGRILSALNQPDPVISVYLKSLPKPPGISELGGTITIGGKDTTNCDSKWTYVPAPTDQSFYGVYGVVVKSFSFGHYTTTTKADGGLTSTTSFITVPPSVLDQIVAITNAEYDFKQDAYIVDCNGTFPDMIFTIDSFGAYHVSAKDYARQLGNDKTKCTLMLIENLQQPAWNLGTTFSRPYCYFYDLQKQQVAFAKLKN